MAISKKYLKTKPICKVTFSVAKNKSNDAKQIELLGEFNNWKRNDIILKKKKDGTYSKVVDLEVGKTYEFRYLVDGIVWQNEESADAHVGNKISNEENSVITV